MMPSPAKHPSERFWPKVRIGTPTECWEWIGARHQTDGYGFMWAGPLYVERAHWVKAHRLSWEMHNGPIPLELNVLHRCDNPPCVNPAHLYVGTNADNARDRARGKRGKEHRQRGEANDNAKLSEEQVRAIISAVQSQDTIAKQFGISQAQVSRIKRLESWSHISQRTSNF